MNFMITPVGLEDQLLGLLLVNFMIYPLWGCRLVAGVVRLRLVLPGDAGELHDHPDGAGGPVAGDCGSEGEAGTRGEEEPADHGECLQQTPAERLRGQDSGGSVNVTCESLLNLSWLPQLSVK